MDRNEYEELIKQGYTEEVIDIALDDVSRMEIFDSPLNSGREDKGVNVRDAEGLEKRTSSIMLGYNKQGITLENGEYLSWEQVEQVLENELNTDEEKVTYICQQTGKTVGPDEIVAEILKRSMEKTYLSHTPTDKVANQQAAQMTVHDAEKGDFPKGVSMLGNDGIQLPSGAYVSKAVIELALEDYIKLKGPVVVPPTPPISPVPPVIFEPIDKPVTNPPTSPIPPIGPEPIDNSVMEPIEEPIVEPIDKPPAEPEQEEKFNVIKDFARKVNWKVPLAIALAVEVLAGFGKTDVMGKQEIIREATKLDYGVSRVQTIEEEFETSMDVANRLFNDFVTGESVTIDKETEVFESSDYKYGGADSKGVIGKNIPFGDFKIHGFSIVEKNNRIRDVEFKKGEDLYSKLEEISEETGLSVEELEPMIHLIKIDGPIAGWASAWNLFEDKDKQPQLKDVNVILDENNRYTDSIDDFKGDTITINDGKEDITIKIKNDDGTFVSKGDIVVGSDGQEYQMTDINVEPNDVIDLEEVKTGTKVNWSLKNITLEEHLAAAAVALVGTAISLRKKKEMVEMTGSQIDELIDNKKEEFEQAKGKYEGNSAFKQATETLIKQQIQLPMTAQSTLRGELIGQNITVEDIRTLGDDAGGKKR